jgi:hypothetical protein
MKLSGNIAEHLKEELACCFGTALDIEVIEIKDNRYFAVAFAAVSMHTEGRPIEAVVCLLRKHPDHGNSQCLMDEIHEKEGPSACFCPTRILDRLTPTRHVVSLSWRKRCRTLGGWEDERWAQQLLADLP